MFAFPSPHIFLQAIPQVFHLDLWTTEVQLVSLPSYQSRSLLITPVAQLPKLDFIFLGIHSTASVYAVLSEAF